MHMHMATLMNSVVQLEVHFYSVQLPLVRYSTRTTPNFNYCFTRTSSVFILQVINNLMQKNYWK